MTFGCRCLMPTSQGFWKVMFIICLSLFSRWRVVARLGGRWRGVSHSILYLAFRQASWVWPYLTIPNTNIQHILLIQGPYPVMPLNSDVTPVASVLGIFLVYFQLHTAERVLISDCFSNVQLILTGFYDGGRRENIIPNQKLNESTENSQNWMFFLQGVPEVIPVSGWILDVCWLQPQKRERVLDTGRDADLPVIAVGGTGVKNSVEAILSAGSPTFTTKHTCLKFKLNS